ANITFPQPYKFEWAKVVLKDKLSSGQSVSLSIHSQDNNAGISANQSVGYSASNPQQTMIFTPTLESNPADVFEELSDVVLGTVGGAVVERFEIWATPTDPNSQRT
ncbi:MAG TPA: hypothetical protein VMR98_02830, partial [Candidatus Polarisedimenticolaceae bacterium]|nr:hypothetical protein [Candidatus Polarisedimenticolaceae bacterium]